MSNLKLSVNLSCSCVVLTSQNGGKKSTLYHNFNVIVILLLRFQLFDLLQGQDRDPDPGPGPNLQFLARRGRVRTSFSCRLS